MTTAIIILGITFVAIVGIIAATYTSIGSELEAGTNEYDAYMERQMIWQEFCHQYYPV